MAVEATDVLFHSFPAQLPKATSSARRNLLRRHGQRWSTAKRACIDPPGGLGEVQALKSFRRHARRGSLALTG